MHPRSPQFCQRLRAGRIIGMNDDFDHRSTDGCSIELFQRCRTAIEAGLSIDAEEAIQEIFAKVHEWAESNPPPDWEFIVKAKECESIGNWHGAENAYKEILDL